MDHTSGYYDIQHMLSFTEVPELHDTDGLAKVSLTFHDQPVVLPCCPITCVFRYRAGAASWRARFRLKMLQSTSGLCSLFIMSLSTPFAPAIMSGYHVHKQRALFSVDAELETGFH